MSSVKTYFPNGMAAEATHEPALNDTSRARCSSMPTDSTMSNSFTCAARKSQLPEPADCDWPHCGCDEHAARVLEALAEEGWRRPVDISAVERDNEVLTNALQRIEAGDESPKTIAQQALDRPSHKALYG